MTLLHATASELRSGIASGKFSAVEVTQTFLKRIEQHNRQVGALLQVNTESALAQAKSVDERRAGGQALGVLAGVPVIIKDNMCATGLPATCGSKILEHFYSPYDATVIAKLKQADAVMLGRANMDEFAMGSSTENSALGVTRNPWDLTRIPGGSSGGSAAAVAADFAPLALGSDTGGSIRQPAGLCGVVGLKPTYGRVSRYGLVAFASSLDQIGPFARTAEDTALLLQAISGHDPRDSTSVNVPVPDYVTEIKQPIKGLKIGIVPEHYGPGLQPIVSSAVKAAIDTFVKLGATTQEIDIPHAKYGVATYYVIAPCECSSNLARFDGVHYGHRTHERAMQDALNQERADAAKTGKPVDNALVAMYRRSRAEGFGAEVKRRIMLGTYALSAGYYDAYYLKALKVRRLIRQDYDAAFSKVDLILGPVTSSVAFKLGDKINDPLAMYLEDIYTVNTNLAGICGLAVPCGLSPEGLPIGMQLQGPAFAEGKLLAAAHQFQQVTDWHTRRPKLP